MMGYAQDEAEEVIGRVLSVIDSTDHFLDQTLTVLEEVHIYMHIFIPLVITHTHTHTHTAYVYMYVYIDKVKQCIHSEIFFVITCHVPHIICLPAVDQLH